MMAHTHLQYFLLVGAGLCFVGLVLSGWLVTQAQSRNKRRDLRLASIIQPHLRQAQVEVSAFTSAPVIRNQSFTGALSWLFGFDLDKVELYPTRWWIGVIGMLGVAKLMQMLTEDFLGVYSLAAVPVAWVMLSRKFFGYFEKRRQQKLLSEFPDALAMIVRAIRVGIPVGEAMRGVSRESPPATASEFLQLTEQASVGVAIEDAVTDMARRTGLTEYRFFATTLALQAQTGGTLSDTLEGLADVIRRRAALKAKGHAMTSEARSASMILGALPFVTGLALWIINPAYIAMLFTDPSGKSMLALAIMMLGTGLMAIRKIIQRTLP